MGTISGYLKPTAQTALEEERKSRHGLLEQSTSCLDEVNGEIFWYTFAGGLTNSTLRHAIASIDPHWRIVNDNTLLRIRDEDLMLAGFQNIHARLRDPAFWDDESIWRQVATTLRCH